MKTISLTFGEAKKKTFDIISIMNSEYKIEIKEED